jgi:hypothetical protein
MAGPPVASLTIGTNPTDPSGATVRFDVSGAPAGVEAIMWRFGDCTDHASDETGIDHTYSAPGDFSVIAVVGKTGQRILGDATVPAPPMTVTGITPATAATSTAPSNIPITIHGTGLTGVTAAMLTADPANEYNDTGTIGGPVAVVDDSTVTGEIAVPVHAGPWYVGVFRAASDADFTFSATPIFTAT